jgi:hypothetical protein
MKFQVGDTTDTALCVALKHEFMRCDDAFQDFRSLAKEMIVHGENRRICFKAYNAYARFIHHLYEFMLGAAARDRMDTANIIAEFADRYIASRTQRIVTQRRTAIETGTAPVWENGIGYYPKTVPDTFAAEFRKVRNLALAHVTHKRSSLKMSDFYEQNHKFLYLLYFEAKLWWGRSANDFPDLEEITSFSVLIQKHVSRL